MKADCLAMKHVIVVPHNCDSGSRLLLDSPPDSAEGCLARSCPSVGLPGRLGAI